MQVLLKVSDVALERGEAEFEGLAQRLVRGPCGSPGVGLPQAGKELCDLVATATFLAWDIGGTRLGEEEFEREESAAAQP